MRFLSVPTMAPSFQRFAPIRLLGLAAILLSALATPVLAGDGADPTPVAIGENDVVVVHHPYLGGELHSPSLSPGQFVVALTEGDDPPTYSYGFGGAVVSISTDTRERTLFEVPTVDAYPGDSQTRIAVDQNSLGNFRVVWGVTPSPANTGTQILSRQYDRDGNALDAGAELPGLTQDPYRLKAFDDGSHSLWWNDGGTLYMRQYMSTGAAVAAATTVDGPVGAKIGVADNGDFVLAWSEVDPPGDVDRGVRARRFQSDGTAVGDAFQINTYTTGDQEDPAVAMAKDGRFAVVWSQDASLTKSIRYRLFDASGNALGSETELESAFGNSYTLNRSAIAYYETDRLVASWRFLKSSDPVTNDLHARFIGTDTQPEGAVFDVVTHGGYGQPTSSAISAGETGEFVISWREYDGVYREYAQVFGPDADSDSFSDLRDNCVGTANPGQWDWDGDDNGDPCDLCDGDDAVGDTDSDGVCDDRDCAPNDSGAYLVDGCGVCGGDNTSCSSESTVAGGAGDQNFPEIAVEVDGSFIVVWQSTVATGDTDGSSVHGQRYSRNGAPVGASFQVNSLTTGEQARPSLTFTGDGSFMVVWQSEATSGDDTDGTSIQVRAFSRDAVPLGPEVQVNTITTDGQVIPRIAHNNGRFMVAWSEYGATSEYAEARLLDSSGAPMGDQLNLNATGRTEVYPKVYPRPAGGFTAIWTGGWSQPRHLRMRHFDQDAVPIGNEITYDFITYPAEIDDHGPVLARRDNGEMVLGWWDDNGDDFNNASWALRLDSDGNAMGEAFRLHHYIEGDQRWPALTFANDELVAVWQSQGSAQSPGTAHRIQARHWSGDGAHSDQAYQISTGAFTQRVPRLIPMWDGGYTVVWVSTTTTVGMEVLMRRFPGPTLFADGFEAGNTSSWSP